jgi:ubiquinone/menaquinone biosynthesis C-methylase UbiE
MNSIERKRLIIKYYSDRASNYDKQKTRTWQSNQGFHTQIIDEITDALLGLKDKTVLEVGVGSGRISVPILKAIGCRIVGLDLSKEMLALAKKKTSDNKERLNLVLGDAEHLPFTNERFDAIVCISTMHYFQSTEKSLTKIARALKTGGVFVYGDLSMHELDTHGFLDLLERTLAKAHSKYHKPSEMRQLLENHGFKISSMNVVPYRKSYSALMEDKGQYFNVTSATLQKTIQQASLHERKLYDMDNTELTLFYTIITALKSKGFGI